MDTNVHDESTEYLERPLAATKTFLRNHERHERTRNFKPQNTLNTLKKPRRRADDIPKDFMVKRNVDHE